MTTLQSISIRNKSCYLLLIKKESIQIHFIALNSFIESQTSVSFNLMLNAYPFSKKLESFIKLEGKISNDLHILLYFHPNY